MAVSFAIKYGEYVKLTASFALKVCGPEIIISNFQFHKYYLGMPTNYITSTIPSVQLANKYIRVELGKWGLPIKYIAATVVFFVYPAILLLIKLNSATNGVAYACRK
jgi:hypothetical protein